MSITITLTDEEVKELLFPIMQSIDEYEKRFVLGLRNSTFSHKMRILKRIELFLKFDEEYQKNGIDVCLTNRGVEMIKKSLK